MNKSIRRIYFKCFCLCGYLLPLQAAASESVSSDNSIPYKKSSVFQNIDITTVLSSLVLCLFIGVFVIYLMNKLGYGKQVIKQGRKRLMIVETKKITTKQVVSIIQVDETEYLIASTDNGCHIIRHSGTLGGQEVPNDVS